MVEALVEIQRKDIGAGDTNAHQLAARVKASFVGQSCRSVSQLSVPHIGVVQALVSISTVSLPADERVLLEGAPSDAGLLRAFVESMFVGPGKCRSLEIPSVVKAR